MSSHWERVSRLFEAARALDAADRSAFLLVACADDDDTRTEVESLLKFDKPDSFLARSPAAPLVDALREFATLLEPGQILRGRYRLEERIGAGGQAIVYRATDQLLARAVVVKILRIEARHDHWLRSRLEQERRALACIDHPGVVGILDIGELADGSPFLVIQYIDGQSLRNALKKGPLDHARASAIIRQVGGALSATHALGIAHRDLKPENIMLQRLGDGTESVKLIDFGIAKIEQTQPGSDITTVMIAGTARYMAPEQLEGKSTPASDIYSLALIACEMLCGYPDLRPLPPAVNRIARRALESALAFLPEKRPQQARAWSEELADALRLQQNRRTFLFAAAGSTVALAGGIFAFQRWHTPLEDRSRLIEYSGGFDPTEEDFRIHNELGGTISDNQERNGYDGWRVTTSRQGDYSHPLSDFQKGNALARGWKLSTVLRAEEGSAHANVDFGRMGPRFDIEVIVKPDTDLVRLGTQILPHLEGLESAVPRQQPIFRRYDLVYDPGLASATLWIEGKQSLTGYRGHAQFQEDLGLFFGVSVYASPRGVGTFQLVRLEINP